MAQIQLKCPNCRQEFDGETDEFALPTARVSTKCPSCGIYFSFKNDEDAVIPEDDQSEKTSLPEDFEVILDMEMHTAFDIPKNRKYREDQNARAKSSAFSGFRLLLQALWNGLRFAVIALIPLSWFGIAGLFLEKTPDYAKWITLLVLPVLLLIVTLIMMLSGMKNIRAGKKCPSCGKVYAGAKIKEAQLVQSDLVPNPILAMTIIRCTRCGTEVTRKEEYPTRFVIFSWAFSMIVLAVVYVMMISAIPGIMAKLTALFILMVTWGVYLFAPVKYGDPLRIVTPEE